MLWCAARITLGRKPRHSAGGEPADDFRPHAGICLVTGRECDVLQRHAGLARVFDEAHVVDRHAFEKGRYRGPGRDLVGRTYDREHRNAHAGWSDLPAADPQSSAAQAVLAIEPLED